MSRLNRCVSVGHVPVALRHSFLLLAAMLLQAQTGQIQTRTIPFGAPIGDSAGNLYFTGSAAPGDIQPTTGAVQTEPGGGTCFTSAFPVVFTRTCNDAFLVKTDSIGKVVFATYLGGPGDDGGSRIALDSTGNIYVAGRTSSAFPVTAGTPQPPKLEGSGLFVAKFSSAGSLLYSIYRPGYIVADLAVDAAGNAYIGGSTQANHAFITKIDSAGTSFVYDTVIGGSSSESVLSIAVDSSGFVTAVGVTSSQDFPTTPKVVQPKNPGPHPSFIVRLDILGKLSFSTYLGGSGLDVANTVQVDNAGNILVAGATTSLDFPTTSGTFEPKPLIPAWSSVPGAFLAKLSPDAASLLYSTYIPTYGLVDGVNGVVSLALNAAGDAYIAGVTGAGFPVTANAPQPCIAGARDIVVAHFNASGGLVEATYAGSASDDIPNRVSLTNDGGIELAAVTRDFSGNASYTLSEMRFGTAGSIARGCLSSDVLQAGSMTSRNLSPGQLFTLTGFGIGPEIAGQGVDVLIDGQPIPVLYAQSRQINAISPVGLAGHTSAQISVRYNGQTFGPIPVAVTFASPELFRKNPGVTLQAAALNEDGTENSAINPAARGGVVSLFGTGFGVSSPVCMDGAWNSAMAALPGGNFVLSTGASNEQALFAGSAADFVCGVQRIDVRVPLDVAGPLFFPEFRVVTPAGTAYTTGTVAVAVK